MKRLSAIFCTVVMLFCSSCGTGLPELDGPVSIDDIKIDIKDSHVRAYLSENCQIDAADVNMVSIKEALFTYYDPDDIQEDDEANVIAEDLA